MPLSHALSVGRLPHENMLKDIKLLFCLVLSLGHPLLVLVLFLIPNLACLLKMLVANGNSNLLLVAHREPDLKMLFRGNSQCCRELVPGLRLALVRK